jgi:glycosyltransferase involved in cell wall biosynthesis
MQVLHVIPAVATRYGGPSAAIVPMCRELSSRGVGLTIVATDADGRGHLDVPLGEAAMWNGVHAMFFRNTFSESFKYSPALASWLVKHVQEADLVHIHGVLSHACLAAASACRRHRVPYIVRPLGTLAPWSLQQKSLRKRALLALGGMRMLRGAATIHYTSSREQRAVEAQLGLSRGVVVPLGIDPALLESSGGDDGRREPSVVAISRIHPKKNFETLINAFAAVTSVANREWQLVIAGSGDASYVESLKQIVAERQVTDRVVFAGWVEGKSKSDLLHRASLFALCSKHENFGLAALEAMAAGVPVLLTRDVDLADDVESAKAGWIVDGSPAEIEKALSLVMQNAAERQRKASAARLLAERFSWPAVASQLLAVYSTIATHTGAPQRIYAPSL